MAGSALKRRLADALSILAALSRPTAAPRFREDLEVTPDVPCPALAQRHRLRCCRHVLLPAIPDGTGQAVSRLRQLRRIAGSTALLGFGLDSGIEAIASVIVIWRFTGTRLASSTSELRGPGNSRSEERRVGKECRSRGSRDR